MDGPLRVLIVDDSALYRQLVRNVLRDIQGVTVVGAARSGEDALALIAEKSPDVVTLDVQMPGMDGLEVLRNLKRQKQSVKALMLSSFTADGAQITTDALFEGAFDFIHKPNGPDAIQNRAQLLRELSEKIAAAASSSGNVSLRPPAADLLETPSSSCLETPSQVAKRSQCEALVLGASTGGPAALRSIIPELPGEIPVPIFIVQHMPPNYTHSLAQRLNEASEIEVVEGVDGMPVDAGFAYIAPGGRHMKVDSSSGRRLIRICDDPPEHGCRPAVDYLLRSVVSTYNERLLAVILTGMGRDGADACRELKAKGGTVFAQHQEGCVVYGMPKAIVDEELADRIIPLERIATAIVRHVLHKSK